MTLIIVVKDPNTNKINITISYYSSSKKFDNAIVVIKLINAYTKTTSVKSLFINKPKQLIKENNFCTNQINH